MKKIAVIGAGLSGLSVAHLLKDYAKVTLFEKSRGVSGRMSTRRAEPYFFDHGAQYFTARTQLFKDFIQPLIDQEVIKRWDARYVTFKGSQVVKKSNWHDQEPRYVGCPGMNHVAKFFASSLKVSTNIKIVSLAHQGSWQLTDDQGQLYEGFDWVICTAPSPQTQDLLPSFFKYYETIQAIEMRACLSLMLGFQQSISLDFDAAHVSESDLSWIAVNSSKPNRLGLCSLVIHSSELYAEQHIDDDREYIMRYLIAETSRIIGRDVSHAEFKAVHGWRYANNADTDQSNDILIDESHKLAVCGDWCVGGRVEGAFTSAYNLALKIKESQL